MGGTYGHEIVVARFAKILRLKRDQRFGPAGRRHEFHADRIRPVHLHHRAQVASPEAMPRKIMGEHDNIERMQCHGSPPGYAVTKYGSWADDLTNQTLTKGADFPFGPFRIARIVYGWPYRMTAPGSASWLRCWIRRSASKVCQSSAEYPSAAKNRALNLPTGWVGERRYP